MSVENANSIRTLLDALDDICILINPDGTIIDLNRRAVEKFKMSNISVKSNIYSLLPGNSQELLKESIRSAFITGSDQDVTIDLEMQSYNWIIHPIKGIKEKYTRIIIFCRDLTSIGETLESSEHYDEKHRQITEFLPQSVFEIDRSGIIRYLNSHARNLLKISSDDIRSGLHYEDFVSESNIDRIRSYFSELMEGKEVHIIEAELQRKDGKKFFAIIQAFPVLEMRSVGGVRGILIDMNEMQNQEDPRKELENKYRIIIENSKEIIIVSQNGKIQFLNPLGLKITGYGLNELIGRPFIQFIHPEDRDLVWDHYRKRLSGDNPDEDYVFRFIDRKGEIHWVKTNAILIDWEGKPATLNMLSEITELINTQEALAASEKLLSGILDFLPDPFFAVNMDGKVIFWNREAERLFGKNAESMIGKSKEEVARVLYGEEHTLLIDLLLHPDELISEENSYLSVGSDIAIGDVFLPSLNGRPVYLWGKATYLYNKEQKITGIIESIRDITQRKEMENNLKLLNQKLSLFTSITRHDIRNQLMMILILVDQIMQTNSEPYITHRITQIDKIISRINDFITRAQEYQEIGMSDPFWKPVLQIFFDAVKDAHISTSITEYAPECGDISIYADPLLEKAFFNIIDNSFKYATGFTKISFGCKITDTGLILSIEDDGPGIPYDDKEAVFSKGLLTRIPWI